MSQSPSDPEEFIKLLKDTGALPLHQQNKNLENSPTKPPLPANEKKSPKKSIFPKLLLGILMTLIGAGGMLITDFSRPSLFNFVVGMISLIGMLLIIANLIFLFLAGIEQCYKWIWVERSVPKRITIFLCLSVAFLIGLYYNSLSPNDIVSRKQYSDKIVVTRRDGSVWVKYFGRSNAKWHLSHDGKNPTEPLEK